MYFLELNNMILYLRDNDLKIWSSDILKEELLPIVIMGILFFVIIIKLFIDKTTVQKNNLLIKEDIKEIKLKGSKGIKISGKDISGKKPLMPKPDNGDDDDDDEDPKDKEKENKLIKTIKQYLKDFRDFMKRLLGAGSKGDHSGFRQVGQVVETGDVSELLLANRLERDYGAILEYGGDETVNYEERGRLIQIITNWLNKNEVYLRRLFVDFGKLWKQTNGGEVTSVANGGVLDELFTCLFESFKEYLKKGCSMETLKALEEVVTGVLKEGMKDVSYKDVITKIDFETADAIISSIAEFLQYCLNQSFNSKLAAMIVRNYRSALQLYIEHCRSVKSYETTLVEFMWGLSKAQGFSKFLLVTHIGGWVVAAGITVFTLYCYFTSR